MKAHQSTTQRVGVLVIKDSAGYGHMIASELSAVVDDVEFDVECVTSLSGARKLLDEVEIECILLDLNLPDADDLEALVTLRAVAPSIAIVVLTGQSESEIAIRALQCGAQDFLSISDIDAGTLPRSIRFAIERKRADAVVAHQAHHDPLTGLANRAMLLERVQVALARARRHGLLVAALFLDLDGFKAVNDTFGHRAGDTILAVTARRLNEVTREADLVARHGGDEFVVLCEDMRDPSAAVGIAHRLVRRLAEPIAVADSIHRVSVSVGIAVTDGTGIDRDRLLESADAAMYGAKAEGGNAWRMIEIGSDAEDLTGA